MPRDRSEYNQRYYQENRERIIQKMKDYYQKNPERKKAYMKAYLKAQRDVKREGNMPGNTTKEQGLRKRTGNARKS